MEYNFKPYQQVLIAVALSNKKRKDMITLTWGWQPPQYEKMSNGNIRVFYYIKPYAETVEHENPETGEVETEERTSWRCNVVELSDKYLTMMIRENPESLECQKRLLRERILAYDSSDHVNSFTIGGFRHGLIRLPA